LMVTQSRAPQSLWIGPWGHLPWGRRVGALDFGPAADSPIDRLQLRWFDRFLKGQSAAASLEPAIQLFVMGLNQWRGCDHWPMDHGSPLYLTSTGLAGLRSDDGHLTPDQPGSMDSPPSTDVIVHDPWRPVPSLGGHCGLPAGPFDRAAIDSRTDVLTYTTQPLPADLMLLGVPTVTLYCRADAPSFDLSVVLSEVHGDGRVINLTQGHCRIEHHDLAQADFQAIALSLHPTACTLASGQQLRLSVAAACFPAYALNSGTGAGPGQCSQLEHRVITLVFAHDAQHPASVTLPIDELSAADPGPSPVLEGGRKRNE
ncbi:MAG: CocE/NonD family hydrolase, partial [Cyanobacteria bacterium J06638_6]